ncbi:GNAT family N-acetyltransferase [Streptomyces sp. H10-C2]|uniref:GNAT family N-acetyltransferase n=1 Tax=unclassified Streptomyces TaxID=2593676 RepID=UPI0024B912F5|nr:MULTISPECIES: GNAT family N-acetyltransferase [unclassified Streptomyces]MDJ0343833.1 GNAT family N-acetyltransferase [Streptomyces sp. PH10-H1]MDJ0373422.1 GNAT family N-acetyltransferase [Streptomyces sp. H10-C2]
MDFAATGRLVVRISPADVGKRVSVRRVLEIADGQPTFSDTIGVLASWDEGVVCVTRRDGETVRIAESSLVAGKVVPPAPVRRGALASTGELQEAASRAWPAIETERLGEWTLRGAGGFTRRANSVLAYGDPRVPLDEALDFVVRWYGERGTTPYLQVPDDAPLAAELERRGWPREADTLVRTSPIAPLADLPGAEGVTLTREPGDSWLASYHRTGELAEQALKVVTGGPSVWFAAMPGAIGRGVVDGRWALFGAVEVEPAYRRKGLATAVMAALARRALEEGASFAYLQVEADNDAARELYDRMGFTTHHGYHYRRPSP